MAFAYIFHVVQPRPVMPESICKTQTQVIIHIRHRTGFGFPCESAATAAAVQGLSAGTRLLQSLCMSLRYKQISNTMTSSTQELKKIMENQSDPTAGM